MGFIHGANRHEEILFPERLDDYITEENPVRFIDAFVDHLNLTKLLQQSDPRVEGDLKELDGQDNHEEAGTPGGAVAENLQAKIEALQQRQLLYAGFQAQ
jgi:hypothetical protein